VAVGGGLAFGVGLLLFALYTPNERNSWSSLLIFRTLQSVIYNTLILVFCYFETVWILKALRDLAKSTSKSKSGNSEVVQLTIADIFKDQNAFQSFLQFLVGEFSCGVFPYIVL